MQYDAATPGNHEFDFGTALLARATGDATYHYVSANIFKGASDTLVYPPHVVVTRGGVKIGITGFTTPGVMVWDRSQVGGRDRKSTRLNSSHRCISYAVFCLKKKKKKRKRQILANIYTCTQSIHQVED